MTAQGGVLARPVKCEAFNGASAHPTKAASTARWFEQAGPANKEEKKDKMMAIVNYSFQKNLKEQARKKKQEEKRLLKLNKKMAKLKESPDLGDNG